MTDIESIEWLKQISDKYIHGGDEWFDEQRCRAIEYAIECIYKRNKWIPVSERLPELMENVLLLLTCDDAAVGYRCEKFWRVTWTSSKLDNDEVTHWMPLPELPKEV